MGTSEKQKFVQAAAGPVTAGGALCGSWEVSLNQSTQWWESILEGTPGISHTLHCSLLKFFPAGT